jgi:hypothetical protein
MKTNITFLNAGYIDLSPALVQKIVAAAQLNGGVSIKFGYASGFGHVAEATPISDEAAVRMEKSEKGPAKPISARGWIYEPRDGSAVRSAPAGK